MTPRVVDPDNFAVPWALRDGKAVHLAGFDGNREGLLCGGCGNPVIYKRGAEGHISPHFAHKANTGGCSLMTVTHRIFRDATAAAINAAGGLPAWMLNNPNRPLLELVPGVAEVEQIIPGTTRRADVLFMRTAPPRALALEIVVTKGVEAEKRDEVHAAGAAIAVVTIQREAVRFAICADEAAMQAAALDVIRKRGGYRLLSPPRPKAIPAKWQHIVTTAASNAAFVCAPRVGPAHRAHDEYRQAHSLLGPVGQDESARRLASWARINAASPAAPRCCPDAQLQTAGGPRLWRCETHNKGGWRWA